MGCHTAPAIFDCPVGKTLPVRQEWFPCVSAQSSMTISNTLSGSVEGGFPMIACDSVKNVHIPTENDRSWSSV